ncbi:hypothetical protein fugu_003965 [Takifugu bimaculatus]|uniref:Fanconi anemia group C protein n=1 Tax=Takifugu bimaculatus TaxID=433685 RepID=A0A4Z2BBC6_9TELE|nr:hypothetical protein fugu_003965 [Takifugu bimaculatus]
MFPLQQQPHMEDSADPLVTVQQMQFWLDKAVAWGQAQTVETQRDTCQHLSRLRDFTQQLLKHINSMASTTETMKRLPLIGQFLGRLCWIPSVTADASSRSLLLQCLWGLFSEHPGSAVERKANQWIRTVLCQLVTEEDAKVEPLIRQMGVAPKDYHLGVMRKRLALLQQNFEKNCNCLADKNQRCPHDDSLAVSESCIPLVTCQEAAPLINTLLQRPASCISAALSEDFLDALNSAHSRQSLLLEEQGIISLWYHNLPSLEEAVLRLLESVLANNESSPQKLEQLLEQALLPKACAQHCSMFLVVNDIFSHFRTESVAAEMHQEAWRHHLKWLSDSLRRLTEEEEEDDRGGSRSSCLNHHGVFEAWFLLVQCVHWVQLTAQLLVTSETQDCGPLLWLFTFYYHPTNRGHHRASQLGHAKEALDHLRALFSPLNPPLPVGSLQSVMTLLSPAQQQQQQSLSTLLIINLLVNFAVFSRQSLIGSAEVLQMVVDQSGLLNEAARVLVSLELSLNRGRHLSSDTNRVQLRVQKLQHTLTHMNVTEQHC